MSLGIWELMLILAIVFVLFGAGKLPQVMNDLGKGIKNLKNGLKNEEIKNEHGRLCAVLIVKHLCATVQCSHTTNL